MRLLGSVVLAPLCAALSLPADGGPKPPPPLRITLLGTGNPRPLPGRYGPSILVEAATSPPTRILVDAGRGAAERLFTVGGRELLSRIDLVLLTHLHSDHVVGLADVWLTGWLFGRAMPLSLKGVEGTAALAGHLAQAFAFDVRIRKADEGLPAAGAILDARDIPPDTPFEVSGVKITPFLVDHGPVKPAYGYRIDYAGRSVVFSGDTRHSENLIAHAKGCDVLVHEVVAVDVERRASVMRDPAVTQRIIDHHTTAEDAGRVFAAVKPKLAVYSHIVPSPTTAKDLEGPTRKTYAGPLLVGEDLTVIDVGETVTATHVASAANSQAAPPVPPWPSAPASASDADRVAVADTRTYLRRLEKLGFAGVVLVAKGDTPLFAEGFGLADREHGVRWTPGTISDIGSITKQFTGAAILKLEEAGKLGVGDPITRYFPGVPPDKAGITLHQLLTHSSGLSDPDIDDFDPVPLDEYVRQTFARSLLFAPGKGYSYSNANFSLLGAILEKLSGSTYETFLRERLFLPNGMFETGYRLPAWGESRFAPGYEAGGGRWGTFLERPSAADGPHWALRANGGIHTTVYDMLRWARALLGGRVLGPESMKKLWSPWVNEGGDTFYGYGWSIAKAPDGTKIVTHNGGNGIYFADLAIVPDRGVVVFVMTNVIAENRSANSLLEQLGMRFLAGRPYPSIPEVVDLGEPALQPFVGTWRLPGDGGAYRLSRDGPALFIAAEGRKAFAVLNSVRDAEPGRLDRLSKLMEGIVAANMKGDFGPLSRAYGGTVNPDVLKTRWTDLMAESEKVRGRFLRFEILGTARTQERDETVVRLHSEKGSMDLTYVWDLLEEGRLRGRSARGLTVRMRLYAAGEREFFTWDGGVRPPKMVRFEAADGRTSLRVGDVATPAVR